MSEDLSTCWATVQRAVAGSHADRDAMSHRYWGPVRGYLQARWRGSPLAESIEDATQEVFLELFRKQGAIDRFDVAKTSRFRAFLYGVVRHVALRFEDRRRRSATRGFQDAQWEAVASDDERLSQMFDRLWAENLVRQAAEQMAKQAQAKGPEAVRRVELLRLRFHEEMPIRDIARRWGLDADRVHKEYAKARREFRATLQEVASFHGGTTDDLNAEFRLLAELLR